jgi:uncharacterized protein
LRRRPLKSPLARRPVPSGLIRSWTSYISVEDAEATAGRAGELGGAAVFRAPFDVLDAGRVAAIRDPTGAIVSLWQPRERIGATRVNDVGALCWNEVATIDVERAESFFAELLGWEYQTDDSGSASILNAGGGNGGMREQSEGERGTPPSWLPYFTVDSADKATLRAARLGGRTVVPNTEIHIGRCAVIADRQGAAFAVFEGETDPLTRRWAGVVDLRGARPHKLRDETPKHELILRRRSFARAKQASEEAGTAIVHRPERTPWSLRGGPRHDGPRATWHQVELVRVRCGRLADPRRGAVGRDSAGGHGRATARLPERGVSTPQKARRQEGSEQDDGRGLADPCGQDRRWVVARLREAEQRGALADVQEHERRRRLGHAREGQQRDERAAERTAQALERGQKPQACDRGADEAEQEQRPDRGDVGVELQVLLEVDGPHSEQRQRPEHAGG